jgi:8-oxo-dGTP diphosphatase
MQLQVGVKALIKNSDGHYLFLLRSKIMNGEETAHWDIPGGRIESNEPLLEALQREIIEETGITVHGDFTLIGAQDIFASFDRHVVRLTYTTVSDGDAIVSDEHDDAKWLSLEDVKTLNLDPYLTELLQKNNVA